MFFTGFTFYRVGDHTRRCMAEGPLGGEVEDREGPMGLGQKAANCSPLVSGPRPPHPHLVLPAALHPGAFP